MACPPPLAAATESGVAKIPSRRDCGIARVFPMIEQEAIKNNAALRVSQVTDMSSPTIEPAREERSLKESLITRIRTATDTIVALTTAEMNAAREGNIGTIQVVKSRLARVRESRTTLLRLLKQNRNQQ
jgi:hypothetical protein